MATARIVASINSTIGDLAVQLAKQFNVTLTGEDYASGTLSVTTTDAQLTVPSNLATVGWAIFYNEDATNYVKVGRYNGGTEQYQIRVPPQSAVLFFFDLAANDLAIVADTATCKVHYLIFER